MKDVKGIRAATIAALLTSFVGLQPATALAQGNGNAYGHRHRYEDRWDRREDQRDRKAQRREAQRDRWDQRDGYYDGYYQERGYWDAARYTDVMIFVMVLGGSAETTASTAARTTDTTAGVTMGPRA